MARISEIVQTVRSKNAGPFWLTIDIFCGNQTTFKQVTRLLSNQKICEVFHLPEDQVKRFEIIDINVIKFSIPRPQIQGSLTDRDMHGATWASLIYEIEV